MNAPVPTNSTTTTTQPAKPNWTHKDQAQLEAYVCRQLWRRRRVRSPNVDDIRERRRDDVDYESWPRAHFSGWFDVRAVCNDALVVALEKWSSEGGAAFYTFVRNAVDREAIPAYFNRQSTRPTAQRDREPVAPGPLPVLERYRVTMLAERAGVDPKTMKAALVEIGVPLDRGPSPNSPLTVERRVLIGCVECAREDHRFRESLFPEVGNWWPIITREGEENPGSSDP